MTFTDLVTFLIACAALAVALLTGAHVIEHDRRHQASAIIALARSRKLRALVGPPPRAGIGEPDCGRPDCEICHGTR